LNIGRLLVGKLSVK